MKRPTWVTIVGVLIIIFGVFGIFGSGQLIFMPTMMEFQKDLLNSALERAADKEPDAEEILNAIQEMYNMDEATKVTLTVMGIVSLVLCAFYLFSGIALIQMKKYAVKLTYWALGLSLGFALVQAMIAVSVGSLFAMFMIIGGTISFTIDMVLLIVVILNDKAEFSQTDPRLTQPIS